MPPADFFRVKAVGVDLDFMEFLGGLAGGIEPSACHELGYARPIPNSDAGRAVMITTAWASGGSSVNVTSSRAVIPSGVISSSRRKAPPVSRMQGCPEAKLTTPRSRQNTPWRNPVPSAFEQASLAANRRA